MHLLTYTTIIFGILFMSLFIMSFVINVKIIKNKGDDRILLNFKTLFGIMNYKIEIPVSDLIINENLQSSFFAMTQIKKVMTNKKEDNKFHIFIKQFKQKRNQVQRFFYSYFYIIKYLLRRMNLVKLSWITEFGTGDAATTGIMSGIIWMIKGYITTIVKNNVKSSNIYINITPQFNKVILTTSIDCIISIKIGYIIIASIKMGFSLLKKGGERNGESSYRSSDENNDGKLERYGGC